jgi:hypothetical protein
MEDLEYIVKETHAYADERLASMPPDSYARTVWNQRPFDVQELLAFLGVKSYMGLVNRGHWGNYFRTDWLGDELVRRVFTKARFEIILRFLHVSDNHSPLVGIDPLIKVRWLYETYNSRVQEHYLPHPRNCVDEGKIEGYQQTSPLKTFDKSKPIKKGSQKWMACDRVGVAYRIYLYEGAKKSGKMEHLGENVVMNLAMAYPPGFYKFYVDNFYPTLSLLRNMTVCGRGLCGTMRQHRVDKIVKEMVELVGGKEDRGLACWKMALPHLLLLAWHDNKVVIFCSNFHNPEPKEGEVDTVVRRRRGEVTGVTVYQPPVGEGYNNGKWFVDNHNQALRRHRFTKACFKWWHNLFWDADDEFVVTSWCMLKLEHGEIMTQASYRERLIQWMIAGFSSHPQTAPVCKMLMGQRPKSLGHELTKTTETPKQCCVCRHDKRLPSQLRKSSAAYYCVQCKEHYHSRCYYQVHTLKK